ncbi:hypothetical protein [Sphingomonas sp. UYP23]
MHKRYHAPATPYQRLLDDPRASDDTRTRVRAIFANLDPVRLLRDIRAGQQRLVALADTVGPVAVSEQSAAPPLDAFLSSLQTIWQSGEAPPTAFNKLATKRGRRRPDPLIEVSEH